MGEQEQGHWVVLQDKEEGYESSLSFRRRVAKYHKVSMRCPKFFHPKPRYCREFIRGVQVRVQRRCPNPTPSRDHYTIMGT